MDAWTRGSGDWDTPRLKAIHALAETDWHLHSQVVGLQVGWTDRGRKVAELIRESLSRDDFIALQRADWGVDLAPLLPQIVAPTLVCSRLHTAQCFSE